MAKFVERVFSGVQPTGNLHLGNYLGAIAKFVELQRTHSIAFIASSIFMRSRFRKIRTELEGNIREVTAAFIACGIDRQKTHRV